ncbi:MAG: hypothetical protein JXM79_15445 [Sedimentisphaerales bacterium]|nr:hypothetical protein [Sedimentisphaerales bacterium]
MKKSGITITFVIVCISVLVAAYGVGVCIREIRFFRAQAGTKTVAKSEKSETPLESKDVAQKPSPPGEEQESEDHPAPADRDMEGGPPRSRMSDSSGRPGMPSREELDNMSEEERREAFAQMRERFEGRRRGGGPQLSDEDRTKMREELEALRENSENMSEEERAEARAKIFEKYGITPRGSGGRQGGERGSGSRRRNRTDEGQ